MQVTWFQAIYIFVTYNLVNTIVYTALNLPYSTMASLITRDGQSRASTQAIRIFCGPGGKMVVTVATLPMVTMFGNDQRAWIITAVIFRSDCTDSSSDLFLQH